MYYAFLWQCRKDIYAYGDLGVVSVGNTYSGYGGFWYREAIYSLTVFG